MGRYLALAKAQKIAYYYMCTISDILRHKIWHISSLPVNEI